MQVLFWSLIYRCWPEAGYHGDWLGAGVVPRYLEAGLATTSSGSGLNLEYMVSDLGPGFLVAIPEPETIETA